MRSSSNSLRLSDGRLITVEHVKEEDAPPVLRYLDVVSAETDFLSFGPGELGLSVDEEAAHIRELYAAGTGFMLKAVVGNEIVSLAGIRRTQRPRIRHVGVFGISVLRELWGVGVGRLMCERTVLESERIGLRRIELTVREDNLRAQQLYRSLGFGEEGRLKRSFVVAGQTFDEMAMALLLDDPGEG